jgi:hypothetical protein
MQHGWERFLEDHKTKEGKPAKARKDLEVLRRCGRRSAEMRKEWV